MTDTYEADFFGWTQAQVDALRRRSANEIDWDSLLAMIALGAATEDQMLSRLRVLLLHLLEWRHQPWQRSRSWVLSVREQRRRLTRLLRRNPSLRPLLDDLVVEAYASARDGAADETGLLAPSRRIAATHLMKRSRKRSIGQISRRGQKRGT